MPPVREFALAMMCVSVEWLHVRVRSLVRCYSTCEASLFAGLLPARFGSFCLAALVARVSRTRLVVCAWHLRTERELHRALLGLAAREVIRNGAGERHDDLHLQPDANRFR